MNCLEVQELFGQYWDLADEDENRMRIDEHLASCQTCSEQFHAWAHSTRLIQSAAISTLQPIPPSRVAKGVMDRIYKDESWRIPVADKIYSFSYEVKRRFIAVIAICLALFSVGLLYGAFGGGSAHNTVNAMEMTGFINLSDLDAPTDFSGDTSGLHSLKGVAYASLEPLALKIIPLHTSPNDLVTISLIGLIGALLSIVWLSRVRT